MIKRIFGALAALSIATPSFASSWSDVKTLVELVKQTGTTVQIKDCSEDRPGAQGYYRYSKEQNIDLLVICSNSTDMSDSNAVWEVVVHEATHVMQYCNNGTVVKDTYVPRMYRELQEVAPHYYAILQQYRGDHKRLELEAFWMELRAPATPIQWIKDFCFKPTA